MVKSEIYVIKELDVFGKLKTFDKGGRLKIIVNPDVKFDLFAIEITKM